jgi:hypothetical protein
MKRISANSVVDAYIATGLYQCRTFFLNGRGGGCGLSAIALMMDSSFHPMTASEPAWRKLLEIDNGYFWGFIGGFDGTPLSAKEEEINFLMGYEDGQAAYAAATAHFAAQQAPEPAEPELVEAQ